MELEKMFVKFKPEMYCLMVHQAAWEFVGESMDNVVKGSVYACKYCKKAFCYPTKKLLKPVYKMFEME